MTGEYAETEKLGQVPRAVELQERQLKDRRVLEQRTQA